VPPRLNRLSLLCGAILLIGCRSGRSDLIEAELRTKDRQLRELQGELERTRILNQAFEQNLLPSGPGTPGSATSSGGIPYVRNIEFGAGTGGVDEDRLPGDDVLILVIAPKDEDGHPVKAVGSLSVQAQEITPEGTKIPLHTWDVTPTQLRPLWTQGLFSSGFRVKLGLREPLRFEKLRVTAQFTLLDGRTLETDKDIRVHPATAPSSPAAVPTLPPPEPILTKKAASLMPPRPAK
jgi:hypothetical protein